MTNSNNDDVNGTYEIAKSILVGCTVYTSLRAALSFSGVPDTRNGHHSWASKGMHIVHSLCSSYLGWLCCQRLLQTHSKEYRSTSNTLLTRMVYWETGYYVYDTCVDAVSIWKKRASDQSMFLPLGFLLHHMVPLCASLTYRQYREHRATKATDFVVAACLVGNCTSVFQHVLWMLDRLEVRRTSALYRSVLSSFLLLFVAMRKVGVYYLLKSFSYMKQSEEGADATDGPSAAHAWSLMPLKCRLGTVLLTLINTVWLAINVRNKALPSFFPSSKNVR